MIEYPKEMTDYVEAHTSDLPDLLQELDRETNLKTLAPQMLSGHTQGIFLRTISNLVSPDTILEIGTFTGFSAICLADGLTDDGKLHTIESNEEYRHIIEKYIERADRGDQIQVHYGNALELIGEIDGPFDLVFIDAAKEEYCDYYRQIMPKMESGGLIIADNVLWSGKVWQGDQDAETEGLHRFNEMVTRDERVENLVLTHRDGLMLIRIL